jgi:uncharacterized protein DUF3297
LRIRNGLNRFLICARGKGRARKKLLRSAGDAKLRASPKRRQAMSDAPPDRLSADPKSPFYDEMLLERGVGVRFKGVDRNNVEEYCVSEKWVRLSVGSTMARNGRPVTLKLQGEVEPYFRDKTETP